MRILPADLLTKALTPRPNRDTFCHMLLQYITSEIALYSDPAVAALYVHKEWITVIVATIAFCTSVMGK